MVQKATKRDKSPRGRPPSFDVEAVVSTAVDVFWRSGFEATSLADLELDTGVNRSTIYNSFNGKEGLFDAAVAEYVQTVDEELIGPLMDGTEGLADLLGFTERHRLALTDPTLPAGCMLANAMVTGDAPEATARYLTSFRQAIESALDRAAVLGETSPSDREYQAATFLACTLGVNLAAKGGMPSTKVDELLDGLRQTVKGWSVAVV